MVRSNLANSQRLIQLLLCLTNFTLNILLFFTITLKVLQDTGGPHGYIKLLLVPLFLIHLFIISAVLGLKRKETSSINPIVNLITGLVCGILIALRFA